MNEPSSYLEAALAVLRAHGKPMHYESIAGIAVKLGYLETTSPNCDIAMSSVMSKDIRENPSSHFAKAGRGIYKLKPSGLRCLSVPEEYNKRVRNLQYGLKAKRSLTVLRKGLFILQQARKRAEECRTVVLSYDGTFAKVDFYQMIEESKGYIKTVGIVYEQTDRDIVVGFEGIQRSLSLPSVACAVHAALELLQSAVSLGIGENRICIVERGRC